MVSINDTDVPDQNVTEEVNSSLRYWEEHGQFYSYYDANYSLRPNAETADIEVRLLEELRMCGGQYNLEVNYLGCASNLTKGKEPDDTEVVRILAGRTKKATTRTIKHEFGHLHGLQHTEKPQPLMNATSEINYRSKKDAVNRSNPWESDDLSVYIDASKIPDHERQDTREQVKHALDYYSSGADGHVSESISLDLVNNKSKADITVRILDSQAAKGESNYYLWGNDIDTDGNLETYTNATITIDEIPEERRGWHTGYWLGYLLGTESTDELPPPFDNPEYDDREDWW